jgi:hypothetical protein
MKKLIILCVSIISLVPTMGLGVDAPSAVDWEKIYRLPHDECLKSLKGHRPDDFLQYLEKNYQLYLAALDINRPLESRRAALESLNCELNRGKAYLAGPRCDEHDRASDQPLVDRIARQIAEAETSINVTVSKAQNKVTAFWILGGIAGVGAVYWVAKKFGWFKKEQLKPVEQAKA